LLVILFLPEFPLFTCSDVGGDLRKKKKPCFVSKMIMTLSTKMWRHAELLCPIMESTQHSLNNLAPLCRVLLELLIISQTVNKFSSLYGTLKLITMLTTVYHFSLY